MPQVSPPRGHPATPKKKKKRENCRPIKTVSETKTNWTGTRRKLGATEAHHDPKTNATTACRSHNEEHDRQHSGATERNGRTRHDKKPTRRHPQVAARPKPRSKCVEWNFHQVGRVRSRYQSVSRKRQADMDDMVMKRGAATYETNRQRQNKDVS